jgi:hypothetical protein
MRQINNILLGAADKLNRAIANEKSTVKDKYMLDVVERLELAQKELGKLSINLHRMRG